MLIKANIENNCINFIDNSKTIIYTYRTNNQTKYLPIKNLI